MTPRASSLPALAQCSQFESGATDWTESGIERHTALQKHFQGDDSALDLLPDDEREGVLWAADQIRLLAPMTEHPVLWETESEAVLPDFRVVTCTRDAVCHNVVFDLKWRFRNYYYQMAAYALSRLQDVPLYRGVITVHVLYAESKKLETYRFDYETAVAKVQESLDSQAPNPTPCDYCGWCAKKLTCTALNERAKTVGQGREDWALTTYHSSEITDPNEMAKALTLARHLDQWVKAVKWHANDMATKQGVTIPGYELKSRKGKPSCHDVAGAHVALGLPTEVFLQCAELRMNSSKDNSAKVGVIDALAKHLGITKAAAKKQVTRLLQPHMRTPKETMSLKPINSTEDDED